jgi:hypothetical protein
MTGLATRIARRLADEWMCFWFEPVPASNLAISRLTFFGLLWLLYVPYDFRGWADVSPALFEPIWLFENFRVPVLSATAIGIAQVTWKVALACSCLGVLSRVSMPIAAVLGLYLLGLPHNFGQTYHFDAMIVIAIGILACSRAGDALSIDQAMRRWRGHPREPQPSGEYLWPAQLICVGVSLVFFAAGVAKLWTSGFQWFLSDHMAMLLDRVQYNISDADPLVNWGSAIARMPFAAQALALTTIVVETAYPVALFSRRLRIPIVLAGAGLLIGIRLLMGPTFEQFLFLNVFWVRWDRVAARVPARFRLRKAYPMEEAGVTATMVGGRR